MSTTISKDLYRAFLNCRYKAHLFQNNCPPILSEFVQSSERQDADFQSAARQSLLASLASDNRPPIPSSVSDLRLGTSMVFDVKMEVDGYYFYKDSRKGDFLEGMLRGFSGVLVSDFFTAYDSLKCSQQKCVIHLLRDINEDLLRNPFDEELRRIVQPFATLFRTIIDTVDRFGLKRRHLQKYKSPASDFIGAVRQEPVTSECAVKYKKRFEKYGERLFTFLDYDGIPWNNNNAEHAIKRFAKYRHIADGRFTEESLGNHLVLLSVVETCEYRELPVLRFLISRATELSQDAMRSAEKAMRTANAALAARRMQRNTKWKGR